MAQIFISYSRVDAKYADNLIQQIRHKYGHNNVWLDHKPHSGEDWWQTIIDHIASCDVFIYLLSNNSVLSPRCQAEFQEAIRLQKLVITIQIRDRTKLANELINIQYIDMKPNSDNGETYSHLYALIDNYLGTQPKRIPPPLHPYATSKPQDESLDSRPIDDNDVDTPPLKMPIHEIKIHESMIIQPRQKEQNRLLMILSITVVILAVAVIILLIERNQSAEATPTTIANLSMENMARTAEAQETVLALTPNITASIEAFRTMERATQVTWTPTPTVTSTATLTSTPTNTFTNIPTFTPLELAEIGVDANANWLPFEQSFVLPQGGTVTMVLVPSGCFEMGSMVNTDEQPIHQICFDQPFWIDKYEVTNAQYGSLAISNTCTQDSSQPDQPRNCVTWFEANDFCQYRDARLPTEAEWEYAARGVDGWIYPWGNDFLGDNTIYNSNSVSQTAPVGSRPAGASWVGAMDMSGNLWEWVNSWYLDYPYDDEHENEYAGYENRVLRGGSFVVTSSQLRSTYRNRLNPSSVYYSNGFRCARSIN